MRTLFLLLTLCLLTTPTFAESYIKAPVRHGNFYLGAGYGGVVPEDGKISFSGAVTGSGNLEYKTSGAFSGLAGFHLSEYLAIEAQLDYSEIDYNSVSGTLTGGALGTGTGTVSIQGQNTVILGMANALISPLGRDGFAPYLGAGVGVANTESNLDMLRFNGSSASVNASDSQTGLAFAGIIGADAVVGRQLSLGGRYRYLWVDSGSSFRGNGITTNMEDFKSHIVSLQLAFRF
jgi:opacity protein-like surface antigen